MKRRLVVPSDRKRLGLPVFGVMPRRSVVLRRRLLVEECDAPRAPGFCVATERLDLLVENLCDRG